MIIRFFSAKSYQLLQVPSQHLKCLHDKIGYPHYTVTGQCSKKSRQFNLFTTTFHKRLFKLIHTNIIFAITAWCNNRETIWLSGNIGLKKYKLHNHGNTIWNCDRNWPFIYGGHRQFCLLLYSLCRHTSEIAMIEFEWLSHVYGMTIIISVVAYHGFDYVIYNFFHPILTRQPDAFSLISPWWGNTIRWTNDGVMLDQHYITLQTLGQRHTIIGTTSRVSWASPVVCKQWTCILVYTGVSTPEVPRGRRQLKSINN